MRILLVGDNIVNLQKINMIIQTINCEDFVVVGCYNSSEEMLALYDSLRPDICIIGTYMDDRTSGIELTKQIKEKNPYILIIFLTDCTDFDFAHRAIKCGIFDYITDPICSYEIIDSLQRANEILKKREKSVVLSTGNDIGLNKMCVDTTPINSERTYSDNIKKALIYIQEHYQEEIDLKTVANYLYLNVWYFSSLFKREIGKSFTDYVAELRISRAKELLENSSLKLYQIAYAVGINDPTYFSQLFKKITGHSPKQYRNYLKNKCGESRPELKNIITGGI